MKRYRVVGKDLNGMRHNVWPLAHTPVEAVARAERIVARVHYAYEVDPETGKRVSESYRPPTAPPLRRWRVVGRAADGQWCTMFPGGPDDAHAALDSCPEILVPEFIQEIDDETGSPIGERIEGPFPNRRAT